MFFLTNGLFSEFGNKLAYLDPGSGSFLVQLLIAALLGIGVALRVSWGRIKGWFGIKSEADEDADAEDQDTEE
jgi:hypothetical protein